jgi:hypothetical protein
VRVERIDRRVLAGVLFRDATTRLPVSDVLEVGAAGARVVRNRAGLYVVRSAPGLEAYARSFPDPPAAPAVGTVPLELTVSDPGGAYLARRFTLRLPRDPGPAAAESVFRPAEVALYPSPAAPTLAGWALVRVSVTGDRLVPVAGALVAVVPAGGGAALGAGMTDARGEALVGVTGVPVILWNNAAGPVLADVLAANLEVRFDPAAVAPPDPDALAALPAAPLATPAAVGLAAGRTVVARLTVVRP